MGRREGIIAYRFLSLLLEMDEEYRADRKERRSREGKLAGARHYGNSPSGLERQWVVELEKLC